MENLPSLTHSASSSGDYLWNAGIFVGKVSSVVAAFEEFASDLAIPLREVAEDGIRREIFPHCGKACPPLLLTTPWQNLPREREDFL